MFQKPPMKIIYCYGIHQEAVKELERKYPNLVVTHQGLPNEKFIDDEFENVDHGLIVLDDLIQEIGSSKEMANLFTRDVHHKVNTFFLNYWSAYTFVTFIIKRSTNKITNFFFFRV